MKHNGLIVAIICLEIIFAVQNFYSQDTGDAAIINFISRQAKAEKADEYDEARRVFRRDIDRDGKMDLIVLYTLEGFGGGNNYQEYLAVFLGTGKTFRHAADTVVGGKFFRDVSFRSLTGSTISLDTKEYRKNDPACCPSRPAKAHYVFRRNKLIEIK